MQNHHSNSAESFRLLQLSDDSKSLSDLQLPEIVTQRKRKVRRKTRSSSSHRYNHQQTTNNNNNNNVKLNCTYLSIWMCVTVTCAWLFLLSYILGIVHSECHQLTKDVKKFSAICLSMPETLQKLHESSKSQEQNQTAISQKIYEIQQRIENFEKEFLQLKENLRKKEDAPNGAADLKDTVAAFGAKIQSLEIDVKSLKDDYTGIHQIQQNDALRLDALRTTVNTIANATHSSFVAGVQNESNIWMRNVTEQCSDGLKNVSNQLASLNDTFNFKIKSMADELRDHQTNLVGLNESFANMSSHVVTMEDEWPKLKQTNKNYDITIKLMNDEIKNLKSSVLNLTTAAQIHELNANQKKSNLNIQHNDESVPSKQGSQKDLQLNASVSKVTAFPTELLDPIGNSTSAKATNQKTGITLQSPQNNTASQSLPSNTTIPVMPIAN